MKILVLNTGSSTVKFSLIESEGEQTLVEGLEDWSASPARFTLKRAGAEPVISQQPANDSASAVKQVLSELTKLLGGTHDVAAVGHRVVHGGPNHVRSERITDATRASLEQLREMAPLHNRVNLDGIRAAEQAWPDVPQIAVFDTAFHATLSETARTYPVPSQWTNDWGLRRYGFHGISVAYCTGRATQMLGRQPEGLRLVVCHLGNGCSVTGVRDGKSVDTSMGYTPLDGLMMGTRSGSVDPGLLIHALREKGLNADDLERILNRESGLLGVSGVSGDMRAVAEAASKGNDKARLAIAIFVHRLKQTIGAMTATLGGLDALVFTAGIGEHSAAVREETCRGLEYLGLELDKTANAVCKPDVDIALPGSKARILVIGTREDLMIVREVVRVLKTK